MVSLHIDRLWISRGMTERLHHCEPTVVILGSQ
ncbi:Uncharacterised protein [Vibrio cholerae]|nr:Uncharacterised protein [Vibrio cholerae]